MGYDGSDYVILLPVEDSDGKAVILKFEDSDDDDLESYTSVDDEETFMELFNIFKENFGDEFVDD